MSKVLITGTSSGIGLATAIALGRSGHTVVATMRNPDRGGALREVVEKERLPISILKMDVDSDESVDAATAAIRAQTGSIDVLVNNAGIERTGSIEGLAFDDFKATMETNYFGAIRTIRAWLPDMRARRSGCIVNVTSVAGRIACSPLAPYSASKYALEALSEALAQEVKRHSTCALRLFNQGSSTPPWPDASSAPVDDAYPQVRRFGHMFEASLERPTQPTVVAEKIREIIESGTDKLRHPVGPDAEPFLGWRASLNDEEWVKWGALSDDEWYERVGNDFGLDARSKRRAAAASRDIVPDMWHR